MMMGESKHIDWTRMNVAVPAFLTMVIQPFTFSIANGIYAGLLFSALLFFLTGEFVPFFRELLGGAGAATDLEADLLPPPGGPLASPGGWSERSTSRAPSMVGALHSATRRLSSHTPYVKTYDMLINTKGEPMPAEVRGEAARDVHMCAHRGKPTRPLPMDPRLWTRPIIISVCCHVLRIRMSCVPAESYGIMHACYSRDA